MARDRTNARYLPDVPLEALVTPVPLDLPRQCDGVDLVALAVPSRSFASVAATLRLERGAMALSLTKGLEPGTGRLLLDVLADGAGLDPGRTAVPDRAEPRRGDRTRTPRGLGAREPEPGRREEAAVAADRAGCSASTARTTWSACSSAPQPRTSSRVAAGRLRRARLRRQREGRADDPRAGRDGAARRGVRRRSAHLRRARGHGRPRRHVHLAPLAQPCRGRADRQGRRAVGDRAAPRDGGRGPDDRALRCAASASSAGSTCRSRRRSAPWSRACRSQRRWSACSSAFRRASTTRRGRSSRAIPSMARLPRRRPTLAGGAP